MQVLSRQTSQFAKFARVCPFKYSFQNLYIQTNMNGEFKNATLQNAKY